MDSFRRSFKGMLFLCFLNIGIFFCAIIFSKKTYSSQINYPHHTLSIRLLFRLAQTLFNFLFDFIF